MKQINTKRDILIFETADRQALVSAVDSCGGIGSEEHDLLYTHPQVVSRLTARVALLEIMAVGARALFAALALSSGAHTAAPLIEGMLETVGKELPFMVSSEKNMATSVTGIGITLTGSCGLENLRLGGAKAGDRLYCAGLPLCGSEVLAPNARLFERQDLEVLLGLPSVHGVIPVGSRGISAEAQVLAKESKLQYKLNSNLPVSLTKSAGPACCAVFAASEAVDLDLPLYEIGYLFA